jgi:hypothetical protein
MVWYQELMNLRTHRYYEHVHSHCPLNLIVLGTSQLQYRCIVIQYDDMQFTGL